MNELLRLLQPVCCASRLLNICRIWCHLLCYFSQRTFVSAKGFVTASFSWVLITTILASLRQTWHSNWATSSQNVKCLSFVQLHSRWSHVLVRRIQGCVQLQVISLFNFIENIIKTVWSLEKSAGQNKNETNKKVNMIKSNAGYNFKGTDSVSAGKKENPLSSNASSNNFNSVSFHTKCI